MVNDAAAPCELDAEALLAYLADFDSLCLGCSLVLFKGRQLWVVIKHCLRVMPT